MSLASAQEDDREFSRGRRYGTNYLQRVAYSMSLTRTGVDGCPRQVSRLRIEITSFRRFRYRRSIEEAVEGPLPFQGREQRYHLLVSMRKRWLPWERMRKRKTGGNNGSGRTKYFCFNFLLRNPDAFGIDSRKCAVCRKLISFFKILSFHLFLLFYVLFCFVRCLGSQI